MIPKIIHYCWFGADMPSHLKDIVNDWKSLMPDYSFYFWGNEHINDYPIKFVKQAKHKKHYAFVSDYFRLRKVYEYGGFYLDTDMLLVKSLNGLSEFEFVICSEVKNRPAWGFFGSESNNPFLKDCFEKYHNLEYDQFKAPVIPYFLKDNVLNYVSEEPKFRINLMPQFFYPMPVEAASIDYNSFITSDTYGVHLWDFSWIELRTNRNLFHEVIYRGKVLIKDLFSFNYSPYYFRINIIRIIRLLKHAAFR